MKSGKLNVVFDAFWGSSGKGKVCDWLGLEKGANVFLSSNMPNAGHTVVRGKNKQVLKCLPSGVPFHEMPRVFLGPGSVFNYERLAEEAVLTKSPIEIHERAIACTDHHAWLERKGLHHIASTMQGSAEAMIDKLRRTNTSLWDVDGLPGNVIKVPAAVWRSDVYKQVLSYGNTALFEVSQGWGLSIDHGTHYPFCTSRNCSVAQALDQSALPATAIGDVIAVIRPYPIRVGNTDTGHSGGWAGDNAEVSWEHVSRNSGHIFDHEQLEKTTVTKRLRRVSTFSFELLVDACAHNGATGIFLNFAQYVDGSVAGKRGSLSDAPRAVRIFVDAIETATGVPVIAIGTGADTLDVMEATQ